MCIPLHILELLGCNRSKLPLSSSLLGFSASQLPAPELLLLKMPHNPTPGTGRERRHRHGIAERRKKEKRCTIDFISPQRDHGIDLMFVVLTIFIYFAFSIHGTFCVTFRNARVNDVPRIAALCAETFEGPFGLVDFIRQKKAENMYANQFSDRLSNLVEGGFKHGESAFPSLIILLLTAILM